MQNIKIKVLGLMAAAMMVGALAAMPSAAAAEPLPCIANYVCIYTSTNYEGIRGEVPCSAFSGGGGSGRTWRSATNRCGSKYDTLSNGICMNAGGNRPNPGDFTSITLPDYNHPTCP